ncbi:MAG TPA: serine hydrolase domain-containing protein [Thermoanaerobaculia bacterium]|nr:serine hydrolase domain-containing protein [Thermoanaerobaculia bacterium]
MRSFRCKSLLIVLLWVSIAPAGCARGEAESPFAKELDRYLNALAGYGYSGAVLVAMHDKVVLDKGYGLADRAKGTPFTADTLFDIASISKPFTAAVVLRLEMQGKLNAADPLSRFFPEAPADKAAITLHQLLTHTSGLPESMGPEYEPLTREAALKRIFATPLVHPPGGRFLYSNVGYSVLAAVVEVVTGKPFGEVLKSEVLVPAGMQHSGYHPSAEDRARLAHGYAVGGGDWGTPLDHPWAPDGPWWNLRGNGGVLTTTGDLYRFHVALKGDKVLSSAARAEYQQPKVPETHTPWPKYSYGWSVAKSPTEHFMLSHVGDNGIFQSDYRRFPDDGAVIAVDTNTADYSAIAVAQQIELRLFGKPFVTPPPVVPVKEAELRRCAGTYELSPGEPLEVVAEPNRLVITPVGSEGMALVSGKPEEKRRRRFADRESEVAEALEAELHGDSAPLNRLLVGGTADGAKRWHDSLAAAKAELGAWKGATVLGTRSLGGQVLTHARVTFEKGERVMDVVWSGPMVDSLWLVPRLRPSYFLPEGPSRFATFDVGTAAIVHLTCAGEGAAAELRFDTPGGVVKAKRRPTGS